MNVIFVCPHGAAKSVIAAEFFRSLASERGHSVHTSAFGVDPDPEIPIPVLEGLREDGLEIENRLPTSVGSAPLEQADVVVLIGCELTDVPIGGRDVVRWEGVPAVSDGYEVARTAIVERVERLLDSIT